MSKPKRSPEDFAAEIRAHLDLESDDLKASGLNEQEARRQAHLAFGSPALTQERLYLHQRVAWLDNLRRDLSFATRTFARNPGFTLTVILTLALAIGANTAIFSLVNALLLKNLPYPHPDRLATLYARYTGVPNAVADGDPINLDGQHWEQLRDSVPSLISAIDNGMTSGINLQSQASPSSPASGQHTQYLHATRVSARYFEVLEIPLYLGRAFTLDEDRPSGPPVAILSYNLWRTTFNADPSILGRTVLLKGVAHTIIGVLPDTPTPLNADIYTALQPSRQGEGGGTNFGAIVRLRDHATWQQADAELNRAWVARAANVRSHNPNATVTFFATPLQRAEVGDLRPKVLVLQLAAGFILLIACANLAGLTLVRTLRRTSEFATRLALGASRGQILRQLWIENLLLALTGGLISIAVGYLALRGLLTLLPENFLPAAAVPTASIPLDLTVLAFTLLTALATSILFGMLPALTTRKIDLRSSIAARSGSGHSSLRLRQALIAGEVALTVVLLAAAGLLIRTLIHLETMPPGFNPTGIMTAKASLDDARFHDPAAFQKFVSASTLAMRQIPGVQNSGMGLSLPYERALNNNIALRDGSQSGREILSAMVYASPGYFETLQVPLLAGRTFTDADTATGQPVAIINQTFATKFLKDQNPIGHYLGKNRLIIGVVGDVAAFPALESLDVPLGTEETLYIPAFQVEASGLTLVHTWFQPSWLVRTDPARTNPAHPTSNLTAQMQHALASVDPNLPFSGFYSMSDLLARRLATQRVEVALLSTMASLALLLSALGIFALVANLVAQRTREIGIRIALGSTIRQAMLNIGQSGLLASAAGLFIGLALCAVALRALHSVLYGIGVYDLPTLAAVFLTLAVVILLASTLPTLRIAPIDPAQTLREE